MMIRFCSTSMVFSQMIAWGTFAAAPGLGVDAKEPDASVDQPASHTLRLSTEFVDKPGIEHIRVVPKSITWKGKEYDPQSGIRVLMSVIREPTTRADQRVAALDRLGMLNTELSGKDCLAEVLELYGPELTREEKGGILLCFIKSEDPRGLPLFYSALDTEEDPMLRLLAANGLAAWNVQRGVAELIALFGSTTTMGQREVGTEGQMLFFRFNEQKGWGIPERQIRDRALAAADGNLQQYTRAAMEECRSWLEENKDRFPNWTPRDELPEITSKEPPADVHQDD